MIQAAKLGTVVAISITGFACMVFVVQGIFDGS